MSKTYRLGFYNLDNNRPVSETNREILAFLNEGGPRPAILGVCEAADSMPDHPDYRKIRDKSRPGRANLCAYVKKSLDGFGSVQWHDCKQTWTRTNPGASGQHPARSWLEFRVSVLQVIVGHQPPKGTDNVQKSQQEGIDLCTRRMAPWLREDWNDRTPDDQQSAKEQARIALADWNRRPDQSGPGPRVLATQIGGYTVGQKIDGLVHRKAKGGDVSYPNTVNGVKLCSDHTCAFLCSVTVD